MALGMMVDGVWTSKRKQDDEQGHFQRPETTFRSWVKENGSSRFTPDKDRYHLYISLACPWAHRTLIMRSLKGLENAITVNVVDPFMGDDGWFFSDFPGSTADTVNHKEFLRDVYTIADPKFTGRVTVPVLWDKKMSTIVSNESREIVRMFDHEFDTIAEDNRNFAPQHLISDVEYWIERIYQPINNGVYRSGFATTQSAYSEAVKDLFSALDEVENHLAGQKFLCGEFTEADIFLYTTLIRFDMVYVTHFKCNLKRILDYPNLSAYLKRIYEIPGIADTTNFTHIKDHYYKSHPNLNPSGIVPEGPEEIFPAV